MRIIGLSGKKGVGKNFVAKAASLALGNAGDARIIKTFAFADALKNICVNVLGLQREQCHGTDDDKNSPTMYSWYRMPSEVRNSNPGKLGYMTAREVMQIFGTEIMRGFFDDDIWVRVLHDKIMSSYVDIAVITDVRFGGEMDAVRSWGGEVWRIIGRQRVNDNANKDTHASETDLDGVAEWDKVIHNGPDDDMESMIEKVGRLLVPGE